MVGFTAPPRPAPPRRIERFPPRPQSVNLFSAGGGDPLTSGEPFLRAPRSLDPDWLWISLELLVLSLGYVAACCSQDPYCNVGLGGLFRIGTVGVV